MKLVIAQPYLTLMGGLEKVLLKVAQHYDAAIYTCEYKKGSTYPEFKDLDIRVMGRGSAFKLLPYGRVSQGLEYGLTFWNLKIKDDYDVLNPHQAPGHWASNNNDRVLWYCHTPLRDFWDLYEFRMKLKKPHQRPVHYVGVKVGRAMDRIAVGKIGTIIANSENTRSRLIKYFGRRDAKVLGGGIDYKLYSNNGDGKYFYYPSRISPNKRQLYAIDAFGMFKKRKKGYKLVIVGPLSTDRLFLDYYDKVVKRAKEVGDVIVTPNVTEDKLRSQYSMATAVLYPPINEDYGLVPLEAMAAGKVPIVANEGGPTVTVLDKITGFHIGSEREMAERMLYVADHPSVAKAMGRRGAARVRKHYSWERFFDVFDRELQKVKKAH